MRLVFLGTANGLTCDINNFHSNMVLVTNSNKKLLIDCGTDIRFSLHKAQFSPIDIDAVYISHLHADHIGGLEWFAFNRMFAQENKSYHKPQLIIHKDLVERVWKNSLSGGMETIVEEMAELDTYFKVTTIDERKFEWQGVGLTAIKTVHIISDHQIMPSYGLMISYKNTKYFLTTDTQFGEAMFLPYYQQANIIFHDCETAKTMSGVHAHFDQLVTLSPEIKAKMWLYHYNDGELPNAKEHGFLGFIQRGQEILLK